MPALPSFAGIYPPIATPFGDDGEVSVAGLKANVAKWSQTALTGLIVLGSNGEFPAIDDYERDVVISTEMLEHVRDWRGAIRNLKGVLRPGGLLVLTTRSPGFPKQDDPSDYWRFSRDDMQRVFTDFVIELIEDDPEGPGVFVAARRPEDYRAQDLSAIEVTAIDLLEDEPPEGESGSARLVRLGEFDFWVPPGHRGSDAVRVARPILVEDEYELQPIRYAGHMPRVIVDVGGNCGAFTLRAADLFPGSTILAFEPDPISAEMFRRNTDNLHATVHFYEAAVLGRDAPRRCDFCRFAHQPGSNHAVWAGPSPNPWERTGGRESEMIEVDVVRLPEVLKTLGLHQIDIRHSRLRAIAWK